MLLIQPKYLSKMLDSWNFVIIKFCGFVNHCNFIDTYFLGKLLYVLIMEKKLYSLDHLIFWTGSFSYLCENI